MGLKRKALLVRQKDGFERQLQDRLAFLSGKGIDSPKAGKDPLVRGLQADIRAVNRRMRLMAESEERAEEAARKKAERAAAPRQEREGSQGEKPKRAPDQAKGKKMKAEAKMAAPKAPEAGKSQKTTESPAEGKTAKS
jgi:hypothetical protein